MAKVKSRITLFHAKHEDEHNPPAFKGVIETPKGRKLSVTLWPEENSRVTKGVYYKGQVTEGKP